MEYRKLGNTGLTVSAIGLGAEWLERHNAQEVKDVVERCRQLGVNILDCWMSEPNVRSNLGAAIAGHREEWIIQGHIGSTWQGGQYVRTRELSQVIPAFEDLLARLGTDYIDLGMIHFVDTEEDWQGAFQGPFLDYVLGLKEKGVIRHIGMSTHNPAMARRAAQGGIVEMLLFSVNPAFDMHPPTDKLDTYFNWDEYQEGLGGIDPERAEVYRLCEENGVGITVMKGYGGGRLFDAAQSPFGVALTPVQCLHYCLTRPAVASVMVGCDTPQHAEAACAYCTADEDEKDYGRTLSTAPRHAFARGQCTYCGHCAPCPAGIDIAMVNKLSDLAGAHDGAVPATVQAHYDGLAAHAGDCIGCGGCESRCPFGVHVIEKMGHTVGLLGQ